MVQPSAGAGLKSFSPRRRLRRRVLIFSGISGAAAVLAGAIVFCVTDVYLPLGRLSENEQTLQRVRCDMQTCDMGDVNADWEFAEPDYILDTRSYFFLCTPNADIPGFPLRYADFAFVKSYETPASFAAPDGESWRLYSAVRPIGSTRAAVMVGYAERATWKMELPTNTTSVDAALRQQLDKIAGALRQADGRIEFGDPARRRVAANGYVVMDIATNEVLYVGGTNIPHVLFHEGRQQLYPGSRRISAPTSRQRLPGYGMAANRHGTTGWNAYFYQLPAQTNRSPLIE